MIFKERTFRGERPEDERIDTPGNETSASLEARAADFLSALPALDATQISVVVANGGLVLSGFVPSGFEAQTAETALREEFEGLPVENRLRVG